jgi:hypothetical protein
VATITGLKASRMLAIEAGTVVGGVVRQGILYFVRKDGAEYPNGVVVSAVPGPTGTIQNAAAGGDLTGTFPNPTIGSKKVTAAQIADLTLTDAQVAAANKDGAVGTPSLRTLGTGAQQAAAGNHFHTSIPRFKSGIVSHTASAANVKTIQVYPTLWASTYFTGLPNVVIIPDTQYPEAIPYFSVCDRTSTGFSIAATRTSTTASNYHWIAMQAQQ